MTKRKMIWILLILCILLAGCGSASPSVQPVTETAAPTEKPAETAAPKEETTAVAAFMMPGAETLLSGYETFEVTSESLHDGVWDDVISNTDKGNNLSPQLSWEPVEGASCYLIYMADLSTEYWLHWKSDGITETSLPLGWASAKEYVGPYPPAGSNHTYEIYVIAVKNPVERMKGGINGTNPKFPQFITALDTDAQGNAGNILSCGHIAGTFAN